MLYFCVFVFKFPIVAILLCFLNVFKLLMARDSIIIPYCLSAFSMFPVLTPSFNKALLRKQRPLDRNKTEKLKPINNTIQYNTLFNVD